MAANDIWTLTGKKLSGEATLQELEELRNLVANNEGTKQIIVALQQVWQTPDNAPDQKTTKGMDKRWEVFRLKLTPTPETPGSISIEKINN